MRCAAPWCSRPAVQRHHIVYRQEVRRERGDQKAEANLLPLCVTCHVRHHERFAVLPLRVLPDGVFAFAAELLGPGHAYEYLRRRYAGGDARLDALLSAAA